MLITMFNTEMLKIIDLFEAADQSEIETPQLHYVSLRGLGLNALFES